MARAIGMLAVITVLAGLWVVNCTGPRPAVADVSVAAPTAPGAPYQVAALVRNQGWGHGQVQVIFRLRDKATGQTVQVAAPATLEAGETTRITAELQAPPGDYAPAVVVEYPPG